jgi:DNA-binding NtrC family response regulator
MTACGQFEQAAAELSAIEAATILAGHRVPRAVTTARRWLRWWQGVAPDVAGFSPGGPVTPRLERLLAADRAIGVGQIDHARELLGPPSAWARAPALFVLTMRWLRACLERDARGRAALAVEIARMNAFGIYFWGRGHHRMHMLQVMPELLQLVNEAEDELAALTAACSWMVRNVRADTACFLDATRAEILSGHPGCRSALTSSERLEASTAEEGRVVGRADGVLVSVPVRYVGLRIAAVVCTGAAERRAALVEAATGLAVCCAPAIRTRLDALALREGSEARMPEMLGRSPAIAALRDAVARAAETTFPVVVEGESGSGKELVARAIHRLSARRHGRFAAINCAALSDELAEAELFGHTRGAFTGAVGARVGLFEEAHLGTLFLDEVAELSARTQARLLRALQEREVRRLGENTPRRVDVRVVAATNRSLAAMASRGEFREDLRFRLAVIRLQVPPLRDRVEDISLLALHSWKQMTRDMPTRALLGADALARLARHRWPGNVRELQNVIAALVVNAPRRGRVSARLVDHVLAQAGAGDTQQTGPLDTARSACERQTVVTALARHGGRKARAARELGLSRQGLAKAIKRLQIEPRPPIAGVA